MCGFISWIEHKGKILFITDKEFEELLRKDYSRDRSEMWGHGAIREIFGLKDSEGKNKECVEFYIPNDFPSVIGQAMKMGLMTYANINTFWWGEMLKTDYREQLKKNKKLKDSYNNYMSSPTSFILQKNEDILRKIERSLFWKLFKNKKNRSKAWK